MDPDLRWTWHRLDDFAPRDLFDLLRLRVDVFVVEQECAFPDLDDADLGALHLTGHRDGRLVAGLRLLAPGVAHPDPSLGRVVVAPAERGRATGHLLVAEGLRRSRGEYPGLGNEIGAQAHLRRFYGRHGFEPVGAEYLEDGIPHIPMRVGPDRVA